MTRARPVPQTLDESTVGGVGRVLSARRVLTSLSAGLVVGAAVASFSEPMVAALAVWVVAGGVLLGWVWRLCWHRDPAGSKELAEEDERSRSTDVWVVLAAVVSLAAVVVALVRSSSGQDATAVITVVLSVVAVVLSWALVNTVFAVKYARLYYMDEPDAEGFDFKQDAPPTYSDFAYLAFTIGMSYAVSETEPTSTRTRRVALLHALLSYLFGTGVLAVAINLVTNLGQ
ncbi:DUF1345 domain-containing protein [Spongisporangium articulatum]|uniref:DUF1345 domain-containing protein n=1 Tax=Spongisporangium articulatum TaxID=3362603 RepID=A0ABW8ALT8_9ACTN